MSDKKTRILIVEDEQDIRELMAFHLSKQDITIDQAESGKVAYDKLLKNKYDLVIMDWMIPDISGLDLISWIKKKGHTQYTTPVLMVTAKSDPESIVMGLETGADDYMIKPFNFSVLRARAQNLLSRSQFLSQEVKKDQGGPSTIKMGELVLNKESHEARLSGELMDLTFSEFKLLEFLMFNKGRVLSRKQITQFVQGDNVVASGRTIDTHISSLRKKLKNYGDKIETIRGVGYRVSFE